MSEIGLERPLASAHSELTPGHDVTHLLSQINSSYKKSKADQILRLLKDQDKLHGDLDEIQLEEEYNQIKEEKVTHDSDTLTDSSSDNETLLDDVHEDEVEATSRVSLVPNRMYRSKTAVGFHKNKSNRDLSNGQCSDHFAMDTDIDTRDISVRPKSSYVRRHFRRKDELGLEPETTTVDDFTEQSRPRPSRSARPQSRHGRASLQRTERKIEMVETEVVEPVPTEQVVVKKDTGRTGAGGTGGANPFQDRFQSSRKPTRESKRQKAFCDNNTGYQQQAEPMCVDPPQASVDVNEVVDFHANSKPTRATSNLGPVISAQNNNVPRNQHLKQEMGHTYNQTPIDQHPQFSNHVPVRNDPGPNHTSVRNDPGPSTQNLGRHEPHPNQSAVHREANHARHEPHVSNSRHDHGMSRSSRVRRVESNNSFSRPRNPEPIPSRQIERPEVRPNTQRRRLQRRYMPQTHNPMTSVRPTSESVILARQKTEKNLLKKQADNRPHSEKIVLNSASKNILSVNENPAQGPQTHLMTKDGVAQSSHVQAGDYRRYEPTSRLKNGARSRDIPADLTLPRPGPNNVMLGGRKPLALMKLPPLEAALAAKKKGLALAARETCV